MPEITPSDAPSPKAVLGTDLANYYVLRVDATGHLQVHVLTSGLPVGAATAANQALLLAQLALLNPAAAAATAANQATMITALQLIDNLVVALGGPGNVRLQVRGEDQLFSFADRLANVRSSIISGADGYVDSNAPPAGQIWAVTNVLVRDATSPTTIIIMGVRVGVTDYEFYEDTTGYALGRRCSRRCELYLEPDDVIRVFFIGGLVGDTCHVTLTGYKITPET